MAKYNKKKILRELRKDTFLSPIVKIIKHPFKMAMLTSMLLSTGFNIIREVKEELTTDNYIVDYNFGIGSAVIANRDPRTPIEIYNKMIETALNVEGMNEVLNNENLTISQKREFITKFVDEVSKVAGIKLEVVYLDNLGDQVNGAYVGGHFAGVSVTANSIFITNEYLKNVKNFSAVLDSVFHECIHATENINILNNKNAGNIVKDVYYSTLVKNDGIYMSSFEEITAYLTTNKFKAALYEKYKDMPNEDIVRYSTLILRPILEEIVKNDIALTQRETGFYDKLTINELFELGISNNYKEKDLFYNFEEIKTQYVFDVIKNAVPDNILKMEYNDLFNSLGIYTTWNLSDEYAKLQEAKELFEDGKYQEVLEFYGVSTEKKSHSQMMRDSQNEIAKSIKKIFTILKYKTREEDKTLVKDSLNLINQSHNHISENNKSNFDLSDLEMDSLTNFVNNTLRQMYPEVDFSM